MKQSFRPWLYLIPVLLCCGLAVVYLLSIKKVRQPFDMPMVTDLLPGHPQTLNVTEKQTLDYRPLYMGKWKERIIVSRMRNIDSANSYEKEFWLRYRSSDSLDFQLLVDTTRLIMGYVEEWEGTSIRLRPVKSYPVMFANLSDDTLNVGSGGRIACVQEALDAAGNWRPIENHTTVCGMGLWDMFLPPGEIAIMSAPVYGGAYRTRLRLRYGRVCSPEYAGYINPGQFTSEWERD